MEKMNKLSEDALESISGGSTGQTAELAAFIRSHDPGYEINDNFDILNWLATKSGIDMDDVMFSKTADNLYVFGGEQIGHETLMSMLNERFPG